ncbi:MAG: serine/threonine protein kinase [Deltaproteobacteria bacterium]|nr:serine/threonine protein kinase [Deltaproteobacteria bacterium]
MLEGQNIGRYRLLDKVGRGGMAEVFRAEDSMPDGSTRIVAIKRLFPKLSGDRQFVQMFLNEARISSQMAHPNLVHTYDLINHGSYYYIVMEFLQGLDLEDLISHAPPGETALGIAESAYVVAEVANGLHYAHSGGAMPEAGPVVHRDISPGNIMVDVEGRVKITDFGIARVTQEARSTQPGVLKGKYEYMAPEYVKGLDFDGRADLFSLGVVFYELLCGLNPFDDVLPRDIWKKIIELEPDPPSRKNPAVPEDLDKIAAWMLAKDPDERVQSGEKLAKMLQPFYSPQGQQAVAAAIGQRVERLLTPGEKADSPELAEFLPEEEDADDGDYTQDIRTDEILGLVEPKSLPASLRPQARGGDELTSPKVVRLPRRRRRWPLLVLGAGLGLSLIAVLAIWLWPDAQPIALVGWLTVVSDRRAEVMVDGRPMGLAPVHELELEAGLHVVEVRRPGSTRVKRYERKLAEGDRCAIEVSWPETDSKKRSRRRRRRRARKKTGKKTHATKKAGGKKAGDKKTGGKKTGGKKTGGKKTGGKKTGGKKTGGKKRRR